MKTGFLFLTLFLSFCFSVNSQTDSFDEAIINYLNTNGTRPQYGVAYDAIFEVLKKQFHVSNVPESVWTELKKDREHCLDEIIKFLTFAYRRHFTREEILEMHRFYQTETARQMMKDPSALTPVQNEEIAEFNSSPPGKKLEAKREVLTKDIKEIAEHWKRDLFGDKMSELVKQGYSTGY